MLVCAVAFSNLQRNYSLPAYVLGILVEENDEKVLESIRSKEFFQPKGGHLKDPFDLSEIEQEVVKFRQQIRNEPKLSEYPIPTKTPKLLRPEELIGAFNSTINKLIYEDLSVHSAGVKEIRLHAMFEDSATSRQTPDLLSFLSDSRNRTVIENDQFSPAMQLARLMVWLEYLKGRRRQLAFINHYFVNNQSEALEQFVSVSWPKIDLDSYANSSLGYPTATIRNENGFRRIPLHLGLKVFMFPIAKSCVGNYDSSINQYKCLASNRYFKFGAMLPLESGENHCKKCRSGADRLKFDLNGIEKISSVSETLDEYAQEPYYIYVSKFGSSLKVGRARLGRGVNRLLEQGCADAVVLYPILTFQQADVLEKSLTQYLGNNLDHLQEFEVNRVTERAYIKDKLRLIQEWSNNGHIINNGNSNDSLYNLVIDMCKESATIGPILDMIDYRFVKCTENWMLDHSIGLKEVRVIDDYSSAKIEGEVKGIIGSLIFLDNNTVFSTKKLQGYLYRGRGFEPSLS